MMMRRISSLVLQIIFFFAVAAAQAGDSSGASDGVFRKVYAGAVKSLAWYDVPIVAADAAELLFVPANASGKPFNFPPTRLDTDFEPRVGVHGSRTFVGQVGEAGAAAFLGVRLLVNVGADLAGADVTSEDYHRTFWFYKSIVYTFSLTLLAKNLVDRVRPDGSDHQSFFSGHSSTAFCTASYLSLELNDWYDRWEPTRKDPTLCSTLKIGSDVALYAGAAYVAYARMHDEKHYFSDVVTGAVVGTLVGTWMYRWHWSSEGTISPSISFLVIHHTPTLFYTARF